jgi:hypothetical protein
LNSPSNSSSSRRVARTAGATQHVVQIPMNSGRMVSITAHDYAGAPRGRVPARRPVNVVILGAFACLP